MALRSAQDTVLVIDGFTGADGQASNWSIQIRQDPYMQGKVRVSLHWGEKEQPTHETTVTSSALRGAMGNFI